MIKKLILFNLLLGLVNFVNSYNICIVGGSSGLGKELIFQGLEDNNKILALTNNPNEIKIPYREIGKLKQENIIYVNNKNLKIDNYQNCNNYNFENIIFTTGAQPFEKDYSDIITKNILTKDINKLKNIILLSGNGVAESLPKSNIGIKVMNNWYLKDAYRAKNEQEKIVQEYSKKYKKNILIIRPKALSYGINLYGMKSRREYAKEILDYIKLN